MLLANDDWFIADIDAKLYLCEKRKGRKGDKDSYFITNESSSDEHEVKLCTDYEFNRIKRQQKIDLFIRDEDQLFDLFGRIPEMYYDTAKT